MARIKLTLAYVGTRYAGWQLQAGAGAKHPPTIQGELEKALAGILGETARVHGSGRTDAGVHADAQVAHFDAPDKYRHINWLGAIQRSLPEDIVILAAEPVSEDFHARFSAQGKVYTYMLWLSASPVPPKLRPFVWQPTLLPDNGLERMDAASTALLGEHDFAAFQNCGTEVKDTVRRLDSIRRYPLPLASQALTQFSLNNCTSAKRSGLEEYAAQCPTDLPPASPLLAFEFRGNGFLKQMVRNLMGFMVACGQGKLSPADAPRLFETKSRSGCNFMTAPAYGLTLTEVIY